MQHPFIKNVKERKERSVLFIKNARTLRSFEKNAKERKNVSFFRKECMPIAQPCLKGQTHDIKLWFFLSSEPPKT